MKYAEKLKDPRWQKVRLKILERDEWTCKLCQDTKTTLHVHHKSYTAKDPWDEPPENLTTLCEHCHLIQESLEEFEVLRVNKYWNNDGHVFLVFGDRFMIVYTGLFPSLSGTLFSLGQLDTIYENLKKYSYGEEAND